MTSQAGTSAQRIRIGLTGLAVAFLLVLLGSVVSRSSRGSDDPVNSAVSNEPNEPLAELGVAPKGGDEEANTATPRK